MAVKLDTAALLKHRFWILLGVFVPLWLIAVLVLWTSVSGVIAAERKAFDAQKQAVDGIKPYNSNWVDPWKKKEDILHIQKDRVWVINFEGPPGHKELGQSDLMTWPDDNDIVKFTTTMKNAYFGDPIEDRMRAAFPDLYRTQLTVFTKEADSKSPYPTPIAPAYYNGGSYDKVLNVWRKMKDPESRDVWLAQEDLMVKHEVVKVIRDAIDSVARFQRVETAERLVPVAPYVAGGLGGPAAASVYKEQVSKPEGAEAAFRFRNAQWELELIFDTKNEKKKLQISPDSTIKNVTVDHRVLHRAGVLFLVGNTGSDEPAALLVEGDPLPWGKAEKIKKAVELTGLALNEPLEVRQYYNWYTSPIKRLDRVEVGNKLAVSHRFANRPLLPARQFKEEPPPDTGSGTGPNSNNPSGGSFTGPPAGFKPVPGGGGENANGATAATGPEKHRYLDVSDQVRRLPVAMVLIVDQAHVPDVLTAVANSKLRLWTTQVTWSHASGVTAPAEPDKDPGDKPPSGDTEVRPGVGSAKGPPMGPGKGPIKIGFPPGYPNYPGYPGMGGTGGTGATAAERDDPNLVELVIYSVASLYERYPPKPAGDQPKTP